MEEEMELQVKEKGTKYNNIMEMAWNWESRVLGSAVSLASVIH